VTTFNQETWKTRACSRFARASAAGKPTAGAVLHKDIRSIDSLVTVLTWCAARKIGVTFVKESNGLYDANDKSIKISGRLAPELQLYVLLHECGHFLVGERGIHQRFGGGYSSAKSGASKTTHHRIDVLDEEFEAWHRGRRLAKRLKIKLDDDVWNKTRAGFLRTYMKWVLRQGGYGIGIGKET